MSASIGFTGGNYKNLDSAKGAYIETGLSGGSCGISVGLDFAADLEYEYIGSTTTIGFGVGTPVEAHGRLGYTKFCSLAEKRK